MMSINQIVVTFVSLSEDYYELLLIKNYSKRRRVRKKLLELLNLIETISENEIVVNQIIETNSDSAILWIAGYALKNDICSDIVEQKLNAIIAKNEDYRHSASAIAILMNKSKF